MIDAVEREFPWIVVEQVDRVAAACTTFQHPVALILVDIALVKEAEEASGRILRSHPNALAAVIQPNDKVLAAPLAAVAASPLFRSVLPMDFRLDIWLSIIRLMLCGGEYFPPGTPLQSRGNNNDDTLSTYHRYASPVQRERNMAELTMRETQILEMVARGLQNKLIAVEFGLSEHTVKVHLHNIIRKLGVHNRTEAAARFRNFTATAGAL
ncbi:response regulator transcription factor [Rhizobium sp. KVB221]|uniref:Response regulator transcription factor n=1 Tax=Rhizobium setariae TaxID=2801340 RepID=A0A936YT26_9HYPH|nr:response regulator transcription factor [Rhizobium setariae]